MFCDLSFQPTHNKHTRDGPCPSEPWPFAPFNGSIVIPDLQSCTTYKVTVTSDCQCFCDLIESSATAIFTTLSEGLSVWLSVCLTLTRSCICIGLRVHAYLYTFSCMCVRVFAGGLGLSVYHTERDRERETETERERIHITMCAHSRRVCVFLSVCLSEAVCICMCVCLCAYQCLLACLYTQLCGQVCCFVITDR